MTILEKLTICALVTAVTFVMYGCGGGSTAIPPGAGTTVALKFRFSTPSILAEKIGNSDWTAASAQGGQLTLVLPDGVNDYAVAYYCPGTPGQFIFNLESVFEATVKDSATEIAGCLPTSGTQLTKGTVSGSVDASAISGVMQILVDAPLGETTLTGSAGTFNFQAQQGAHDIAFTALDVSNNIIAVKIVPLATIPGIVNNGNTVTFSSSDATTFEGLSVTNLPIGSGATGWGANYFTANGTSFRVSNFDLPSQYSVVPPSEAQTGDRYEFWADSHFFGPQDLVSTSLFATSAAAVSLALPTPLPYSAPTPATFPSIPVTYPGSPASARYGVGLQWFSQNVTNFISVDATAAYQGGAPSLSIPDLTGISGFIPPAETGTLVNWTAEVSGGTPAQPAGTGTRWLAINSGTYTEP